MAMQTEWRTDWHCRPRRGVAHPGRAAVAAAHRAPAAPPAPWDGYNNAGPDVYWLPERISAD